MAVVLHYTIKDIVIVKLTYLLIIHRTHCRTSMYLLHIQNSNER
jgi:hypothetical protein